MAYLSCISTYNIFFFSQVPERLYQLVDRSTDGLVTADQVMEFIAGLQSIRQVYNNNTGFIFVHTIFCPSKKMFNFSRAHSHALTNAATRRHEYFRGLSRLLPVPGRVLVSFLELCFLGKMALLALRGRPQPLSKSPLKVKRDIFTRK